MSGITCGIGMYTTCNKIEIYNIHNITFTKNMMKDVCCGQLLDYTSRVNVPILGQGPDFL